MTNYENVTGTIQLEVKADELQSIKTEGNLGKSNYTWGEEFSLKGITVKAVYESGTEVDVTKDVTYSKTLAVGQTTVEISYEGQKCNVNITVDKATYGDKTASGLAKKGASGTVDLSALIVEGGEASIEGEPPAGSLLTEKPTITNGKLKFTFKNDANMTKPETVTVKVTSTNYADYTITVTLTVTDKDVPTVKANDITVTYTGERVPEKEIKGTAMFDGKAVEGTWRWKDTEAITNVADSGPKTVLFTPSNNTDYVTDCINKKVKKNRGERTMYYVENSHPAIVSRDLFNQVQQEMTRRSSKRKVLQKSGKTELGKYSGKYALTELLVCGECGSPYKRVTWARNGEKRIVWRCVSRLEFGTKYCQHSPTLDEGRLHSAILAAMNEYAAIRQEVCPDVLAMAEEAKQALSQAGARLLQLKKRMDAVSREQSDVLDRLLVNMADTELNARMKALTDEKESLKAQIADAQQAEVNLEEQAARRRQMWDSIMECAAGYTEFDNELVRQVIQKITVEDAETIHIHFRDSDVVLEQEVE